jgi:flagellar export protein FliJ
MARDPLTTVLRLRCLALDEARRELGRCLAAEDAANAERRAAELAIQAEERVASSLEADDGAVEAFAAWLPRGRQAVAQAESAYSRAETATAQARARLSVARAAADAAEQMIETRRAAARTEDARKAQMDLDETAAVPRNR